MKFISGEKKRGVIFISIALLCGVIAFVAFLSAGSKMSPSVPVLVAVTDINPGQPLHKDMFEIKKLPEAGLPLYLVPAEAEFVTAVAAHGLSEGDILRETAILSLDSENPSFFSARLRSLDDPDLRATEIPLENIKGLVTGMNIQDYVDIIAVFKRQLEMEEMYYESEGQSMPLRDGDMLSETIIRSAPVIGIRAVSRDPKATETQSNEVLVVALTEEQVEILTLYRELGKIYASLRPFGITEVSIQTRVQEPRPYNRKIIDEET